MIFVNGLMIGTSTFLNMKISITGSRRYAI